MRKRIGDYIMEEEVGAGAYGAVYRGKSAKPSDELFAIKMIPKKDMSKKVLHYLERETEVVQMINSEHVVKLKDLKATENHYYLIFEYCNGGDLSQYRKSKGGRIAENVARFLLSQIVQGMDALYAKNAIHRDLKLSNILLHYPSTEARTQDRPVVKLGDFGFARLVASDIAGTAPSNSSEDDTQAMSIVGTPLYMAPELLHKEPYSFKADIWSLGACLYEMLCGHNCFTGNDGVELLSNINKGVYKIPKSLGLSCECLDFILSCLQADTTRRVKWTSLRQHPYVTGNSSTPFSLPAFRLVNPAIKDPLEDEQNYLFSSGVLYTFPKSEPAPSPPPESQPQQPAVLKQKEPQTTAQVRAEELKEQGKPLEEMQIVDEAQKEEVLFVEEVADYLKIDSFVVPSSGSAPVPAVEKAMPAERRESDFIVSHQDLLNIEEMYFS